VLGLVTRVGTGRWGAGLRFREWTTEQFTGWAEAQSVRVQGLALEATGRFRIASAGRLFLGYEPEHIALELEPGAEPVTVTFAPIESWLWSLGVGLERPLGSHVVVGAELERDFFTLDTAHRAGSSVVTGEESFGATNLRLTLSWEWGS
jgi:hypothetical protein